MQRFLSFYLTGLFFIITAFYSPANAQANKAAGEVVYNQLLDLLNQKDFFRLEAQYNSLKQNLSNKQRLYLQSYIDNAFNKNKKTVKNIHILLKHFPSGLADTLKVALYQLLDDSYFKLFQYSKAAHIDSIILNNYSALLDSTEIDDIKNNLIIRNGLKKISPQQTTITDNTTIPWKRDKVGLIEIPVKRHTTFYDAIFDTRANISSISQTYANKLGLRILPVFYKEGSGITGIQFNTGLAIADSLYIGNILIQNAVFQVMPDSVLYIAPIDFRMNIIIGFPIIAQFKQVDLYMNGTITIPVKTSQSNLHNFALDGLDPVISLKKGDDTLNFDFDLGATQSVLFYAYFKKYRQTILEKGTKKTTEFGGAGGMLKKEVYTLPSVALFLGNKRVVIDSVDILTQKISPKEKSYGNLGQDFIRTFHELTINFQDMYIKAL